ncbi:MAG: AAA family ATPase [Spirochaetes bacterium]|nr:AAA family ATPase [Spirochaetota bacterium]
MNEIISFLSNPKSYNHSVDTVNVVQTHISYVFIAKPYVYKLKKPVDFGFLNFVSFEDRKFYTFEEYRLNSRISPEIYLGVVAIVKDGDSLRLVEEGNFDERSVVAYCVKMKYIDDIYSLKHIIRHKLDTNLLSLIAQKIYAFHKSADNTEGLQGFGGIKEISKNSLENFDQIEKYIGAIVTADDYDFMRNWTENFITQHTAVFENRNAGGFVRDCHGDLHCEHIYYKDGAIIILDCIEFNKRFRYIDTISDIAFLLMDLDINGKKEESNRLCAQYIQLSGDYDGVLLLPFYKAYRAMVRAKINSFQSDNEGITQKERDGFVQKASQYFQLAKQYMQQRSNGIVYTVFGNIGSGKSTIAMELAALTGGVVINSDAVRKKLAGLDIFDNAKAKVGEGIYNPEMTERVYLTMKQKALAIAQKGNPVILDGTFYSKKLRNDFYQFFQDKGIAMHFIFADCSQDELIRRIEKRQKDASISDATVETFMQLKDRFENPDEDEPEVYKINTETGIDDIYHQLKNLFFIEN